MSQKTYRIAGINFSHMHMGDLLRHVHDHPHAEIAGIFHPEREPMEEAIDTFSVPDDRVFTDLSACMETARPDIAIICSSTAEHATTTEQVAAYGCHILVEKPFAASLAEADRMIAAMKPTGKSLMINWPLRWVPSHVTTKRLIDEGRIGDVKEVHYYDGNRGPLRHGADKIEKEPGVKADHWWYQRKHGGGSLLDYLGYGVTLGTWFNGGRIPLDITSMVDDPQGLEVDEHSITIARYENGLSKFETRWGTFTDPWAHQPQPKCGFVIVGTAGTIASYDYESTIRVQTEDHPEGEELPVDTLEGPAANPIAYLIDRLEQGLEPDGPLGVPMARIGQQIVDTAVRSAAERKSLPLIQ